MKKVKEVIDDLKLEKVTIIKEKIGGYNTVECLDCPVYLVEDLYNRFVKWIDEDNTIHI